MDFRRPLKLLGSLRVLFGASLEHHAEHTKVGLAIRPLSQSSPVLRRCFGQTLGFFSAEGQNTHVVGAQNVSSLYGYRRAVLLQILFFFGLCIFFRALYWFVEARDSVVTPGTASHYRHLSTVCPCPRNVRHTGSKHSVAYSNYMPPLIPAVITYE